MREKIDKQIGDNLRQKRKFSHKWKTGRCIRIHRLVIKGFYSKPFFGLNINNFLIIKKSLILIFLFGIITTIILRIKRYELKMHHNYINTLYF